MVNGEEIVGAFYENELQKINQKNLGLKNYSREKVINCMLNGKTKIVHLIVG